MDRSGQNFLLHKDTEQYYLQSTIYLNHKCMETNNSIYVIVIQLQDLISVNAPNSYVVESLLPSKQTLIMINKLTIVGECCGSGIVSGWAQERLWQRWEQCYCQHCVFPGGKHIVWPNAATIGNKAHSLVLLRSVKTKKRENWREHVCRRTVTCSYVSHAAKWKCFTVLIDWICGAEGRAVACIFLHGWINTTSRRGTGLLYYPLDIIIDD